MNEAGSVWLEVVWVVENVHGWWEPDFRSRVWRGALVPVQEGLDEGYSVVHRTGQWREDFLWFHVCPF